MITKMKLGQTINAVCTKSDGYIYVVGQIYKITKGRHYYLIRDDKNKKTYRSPDHIMDYTSNKIFVDVERMPEKHQFIYRVSGTVDVNQLIEDM